MENLLGQLLGFCELLLDELHKPGRAALRADLERIRETATRITGLVREGFVWPGAEPGSPDLLDLQQRLCAESDQLVTAADCLAEKAAPLPDDEFKSDLYRIVRAARDTRELARTALAFGPLPDRPVPVCAHPSPVSQPSAPLPEESLEDDLPAGTLKQGAILVVDDLEQNRAVLERLLSRLGYTVRLAANGQSALDSVAANAADLILLDILMPGLDGIVVLQRLKANPAIQHIPVIMLSSSDQIETIVRCIKLGADDFLPKPFNTTLLMARIESSLSKKRLRDQERRTYEALLESQKRLATELAEAAVYVRSLLPPPMDGTVKARWCFQPCAQLGGDIFGYHWVREGQLAVYLLDVSGHGVGAALLSVSILNVLRAQSLPETDFGDPASVLDHLNRMFQMDRQNNLIFTIWYGVLDVARRELTYASAGHPPAVLIERSAGDAPCLRLLGTNGKIAGCDPEAAYRSETCTVPPGSRLFVFSDGVYEILRPDGRTLQLADLIEQLNRSVHAQGRTDIEQILAWTNSVRGTAPLEDDLSLMEIAF